MKLDIKKTRRVMARRLFTQTELAVLYGCTRQRMQQIVNSENLSVVTIGKLARALNVDIEEIIQDED